MGDKLIINVALTGCVHPASTPDLPVMPEEVGADAARCADEGASVFHVHARDVHGNPAWGVNAYRAYVDAVREAVPGAVVCASLSGRRFRHFEHRSAAIGAGPDMASLTLGSVDFADGSTGVNGRNVVKSLLEMMGHWGVKPEFEAFDLGHCFRLQEMVKGGSLARPYANVILGVHVPAHRDMLLLLVERLGPLVFPSATAVGRDAWNVQRWAVALGLHVRVGMEDSLWMGGGDRATNPRMVERAVLHGRLAGREPATVWETRQMLGLKGKDE